MSVLSVEGLAGVISTIQAPQLCPEYPELYTGYVEAVKYVADVYVARCVLPHDSGDCAGLDRLAAVDPLVHQAERGFELESKGKVLEVLESGVTTNADHGDGLGIAHRANSNSVSGVGAFQIAAGEVSISRAVGEVRKKTKRKSRKSKIVRNGDLSPVNFDSGLRHSNAVIDAGGLDSDKSAKCLDRFPGVSDRVDSHDLCSDLVVGDRARVASIAPVKSIDRVGRLGHRPFSPDLVSWRSSDDEISVSGSDERDARSSYWRRKHIENCLAIRRGMAALEAGEAVGFLNNRVKKVTPRQPSGAVIQGREQELADITYANRYDSIDW